MLITMDRIDRMMSVEDLITAYPGSVRYLIHHNVPCLVCGEPIWGTVEEAMRGAGKTDEEINVLLTDLSAALMERT